MSIEVSATVIRDQPFQSAEALREALSGAAATTLRGEVAGGPR
jgi:hypothetical protein